MKHKQTVGSQTFPSKDIAVHYLLKSDSFVQDDHPFDAGVYVEPHFHPFANEWIIVDNGKFILSVDFKETEHTITGATSFKIPAGHIHSLKTITPVSYTVLRDREDKLFDLEDLTDEYHKKYPKMAFLKNIYSDKNMNVVLFKVAANSFLKIGEFTGNTLYRVDSGNGWFVTREHGVDALLAGNSLNNKKLLWTDYSGIHGIRNLGNVPLEGIIVNYKNK